jgi:hypothetical protein
MLSTYSSPIACRLGREIRILGAPANGRRFCRLELFPNCCARSKAPAMRPFIAESNASEAIIQALLTHLAPTLEHLRFDQQMYSSVSYVPIRLPVLKELTCHLRCSWNQSLREGLGPIWLGRQLPLLECLHFVTGDADQSLTRIRDTRNLPP